MKALFPRCSRRRAPAAAMPDRAVQREYRGARARKSRRGMSGRPAIMKGWPRESRRRYWPDRQCRLQAVRVRLLGEFAITAGDRAAGPWPRPSARRLCALLLVSPGRRVTRDLACEELFPRLEPRAAARSLSKALSMARTALAELGEPGAALLGADLTHLWLSPEIVVDADAQADALHAGLAMAPGQDEGRRPCRGPRGGRRTAPRRAVRRLGGPGQGPAELAAPGGKARPGPRPGEGRGAVRPAGRDRGLARLPRP